MALILKTSLSFASLSNADLLLFVNGVLAGFLTNPNYPAPTPIYADMVTLRNEYSTAIDNAKFGGTHLNNIKRDKRNLVIAALRKWALYVDTNSFNYSRTIMETSGFKIKGGSHSSRGIPNDITNLIIKQGKLNGTAKVIVNVVPNATYYILRYAKIAKDGSIGNWVEMHPSTSSRMLITGLESGYKIRVQVCAGNSHGLGNWSVAADSKFLN